VVDAPPDGKVPPLVLLSLPSVLLAATASGAEGDPLLSLSLLVSLLSADGTVCCSLLLPEGGAAAATAPCSYTRSEVSAARHPGRLLVRDPTSSSTATRQPASSWLWADIATAAAGRGQVTKLLQALLHRICQE
jgi:hypothetical protein